MFGRILLVGVLLLAIGTEGYLVRTGPYGAYVTDIDELNPFLRLLYRKQCVCMNWRYCEGTINSDVICPQSYAQVCCIQPDPEPNPGAYNNIDCWDGIDDRDKLEIPGLEEIPSSPC